MALGASEPVITWALPHTPGACPWMFTAALLSLTHHWGAPVTQCDYGPSLEASQPQWDSYSQAAARLEQPVDSKARIPMTLRWGQRWGRVLETWGGWQPQVVPLTARCACALIISSPVLLWRLPCLTVLRAGFGRGRGPQ